MPSEEKELSQRRVSIDGYGNIVGSDSKAEVIKQTAGYQTVQVGSQRVKGSLIQFGGGLHLHTNTSPADIPLQRPSPVEHFTNRERVLKSLLNELQPGCIVTLCGPGGIGKTALAAKAVWMLAPGSKPSDRFPDGFIFHDFKKDPKSGQALEHIALTYGQEPHPTPRAAALRVLAGRQALLILDGFENVDDIDAIVGVRGSCAVLITSRAREYALGKRLDVESLEADDAVNLLQKWSDGWTSDTVTARRICALVGYLPFAIRLVGRRLVETEYPAEEYLGWLCETPLEALSRGKRQLRSVDILLKESLAQVSKEACDILSVVGLLAAAPFERKSISFALGRSRNQLHQPLGELVNYSLLSRVGDRYEVSHTLVHTYVNKRLKPPNEILERLSNYYYELTRTECRKGIDGYRHLDPDRRHIVQVIGELARIKDWEAVRKLVKMIGDDGGYLASQQHWAEWVTILEQGIEAASADRDCRDECLFLTNLGKAYNHLKQCQRARGFLEQALVIAREDDERGSEGVILGNLGNCYYNLGELGHKTGNRGAISYYTQALAIAREVGERRNEGNWLASLANVYYELGKYGADESHHSAVEYYDQALAINQETGDRRSEAMTLGNLGNTYLNLGRNELALDFYKKSLFIACEIGDQLLRSNRLSGIGSTYHKSGHIEKAIEYYVRALSIATDPVHISANLGNLGEAYLELEQMEKAMDCYDQALKIAHQTGYTRLVGHQLNGLGRVCGKLGQKNKAEEYFQQAVTIAREAGYRQDEVEFLWYLGELYEQSDPDRAAELMQHRVDYEREKNHRESGKHAAHVTEIRARINE